MSSQNLYQAYLERFNELVGHVEVGQVGSFRGKLVKKLAANNFEELQGSYDTLLDDFRDMVRRSETIDERVVIQQSPVLP